MMWNRISIVVLVLGGLLSLVATGANYFYLSSNLGLSPGERLATSIDVFIAMITAVGVIYAGLSLKQVSVAQSDASAIERSRYVQHFMEEWEIEVETALMQIEREGLQQNAAELKKILWYFRKVGMAMQACPSTRKYLSQHLIEGYFEVQAFLDRLEIRTKGILPTEDVDHFESLAPMFARGR